MPLPVAAPLIIGGLFVAVRSVIDSCRTPVTPSVGSVVYTDLLYGYAEHSGIYIGDEKIVELNSKGKIALVSPAEFMSGGTGRSIYVSCVDEFSVGSIKVASRAKAMVGSARNYNIILDNCHQFSAGCLTGNFENPINFLWMLKDEASKHFGANIWRKWNVEF